MSTDENSMSTDGLDDENPAKDAPPPLPRFEPLTRAELAEKQRRFAVASEALRAKLDRDLDDSILGTLESLQARVREDAARRRALPCYEPAQRGDTTGAAAACDAAESMPVPTVGFDEEGQ